MPETATTKQDPMLPDVEHQREVIKQRLTSHRAQLFEAKLNIDLVETAPGEADKSGDLEMLRRQAVTHEHAVRFFLDRLAALPPV